MTKTSLINISVVDKLPMTPNTIAIRFTEISIACCCPSQTKPSSPGVLYPWKGIQWHIQKSSQRISEIQGEHWFVERVCFVHLTSPLSLFCVCFSADLVLRSQLDSSPSLCVEWWWWANERNNGSLAIRGKKSLPAVFDRFRTRR